MLVNALWDIVVSIECDIVNISGNGGGGRGVPRWGIGLLLAKLLRKAAKKSVGTLTVPIDSLLYQHILRVCTHQKHL